MTSAKRSNSAKSAAKSSASPAAADRERSAARIAARGAAACDVLGLPQGSATIVVAASGGADSAAALHVVRYARPDARLIACYVDHQMRPKPSIAGDRRAVRAQARASNAESAFVRLTAPVERGASIEGALRTARYRALAAYAASVGARVVVTGHQRDDVAESALMALIRGSGLDGIAAIRPRNAIASGVDIVRPLLWASKSMLAGYADAAGLAISLDETNKDVRFRRNAIRALLGDLEKMVPGVRRAIARSAVIAMEDKALLDALTASARARCATRDGAALASSDLRKLPLPLLRRVIRLEVRRVAGSARDFSYDHCSAIARAVIEGRGGSFHAGRARIALSGGRLSVAPSQAGVIKKQEPPLEIVVPRTTARAAWAGGQIQLTMRRNPRAWVRDQHESVALDGSTLAPGTILEVRVPRTGDRFVPAGRQSVVPLARFLAKQGVPRDERSAVPLLCLDGKIVAALGVRAGAGFIALAGRPVLEVRWRRANAPHPPKTRR